jgi:tryptophan synthase alpha chain
LYNIFLITPQTSDDRIRQIDAISKGFIYMVSSAATTGAKDSIASDQEAYFDRVCKMGLKNPLLIGFGISDQKTFSKACEYAAGGIIGSAFIKALDGEAGLEGNITNFISGVLP